MIQIINTGVANIRSLQAAFDRLGEPWQLTENAAEIETASHVVLPGVGAFAAAVESIDRLGLRETIIERINTPQLATLSICLGMQLLGRSSEECGHSVGLGVIPHEIKRFGEDVKVPQLGWNAVQPQTDGPYEAGEAYFANSYRLGRATPRMGLRSIRLRRTLHQQHLAWTNVGVSISPGAFGTMGAAGFAKLDCRCHCR